MNLNVDKSQWTKVSLGDVATEYSSRINDPSSGDRERFVGSSCIGQWDFRVQEWESTASVTSAMKLFEEGDYLLVRRSLYASDFRERAPRAHFAGVCSGDILTIRENPEFIADGFLIGILNNPSIWSYIVANASGSITRRIKWKDLANYEFLLPPKDQQAEIAELLWALDESLQQHSLLEKCIQSLRQASAKEVGKFAFRKWQDELPVNWTLKTIGQIGQVQAGTTPLRRNPEFYNNGDIPWVKTLDLTDEIIQSTEEAITDLAIENTSCKIRPEGTVLVAMYGGFNQIGRSGVLGFKAATNQAVCGIELDRDEVLPNFLNVILKSNRIYWRSVAISSRKDPNITKDDVLRFRVPLPPINVQEEVVTKDLELLETCILANAKYATLSVLRRVIIEDIFGDV